MFRIESFLCSILIKAINITTNIYLYTFPTPQSNFKASAKLTLIKGILQHQKLKSWGGGSTRQRKLPETPYSTLGNLTKFLTNGKNMKEFCRPRSFHSARFFSALNSVFFASIHTNKFAQWKTGFRSSFICSFNESIIRIIY